MAATSATRVSSARRALGAFLGVALLATVGLVAGWAARATMTSEVANEGAAALGTPMVWAEALTGSVGRSLPLSTTVRQPSSSVAANTVTGVVTSTSPGEVDQGDVVYVVGDTPVRVVEARAPFWRDLGRGAKGTDVESLQGLLIYQGHLSGKADGDFGEHTEKAVNAWQKAHGREQTGVVPLGELVAIASLPAVVQLGEGIVVGKALIGGEDAVLAPTGELTFTLGITEDQARMIPADAVIEMTYEDLTWTAVIAGSAQDEHGSMSLKLTAAGGGEVCGDDCWVLPHDTQVTLRSQVAIEPKVSGTTVPAAAVHTRPNGTAYVITDTGVVDVEVRGSSRGIAVVEGKGVEPGTLVQVVAETTSRRAPPSTSDVGDAGSPQDG